MYYTNKLFQQYGHSCQLCDESATDLVDDYYPGDSYYAQFRRAMIRYKLASETHPQTKKYIKSHARVTRDRQIHLKFYPCMIHPFSNLHMHWRVFMAPIIIASLLTIPIEVNSYFLGYISRNMTWIVIRLLLDAICFIDIIFQLFRGYYDKKDRVIVLSPCKRLWISLRTYLIPSLFTSVPTYLFVLYLPDHINLVTILLILKLNVCFYWLKLRTTINLLGEKFGIPYFAQNIPKLILIVIIALHWFACIQSMFYSLQFDTQNLTYYDRHKWETTPIFLIVATHFNSTAQILHGAYGDLRLNKTVSCWYYLYVVILWLLTAALKMIFIVKIKTAIESVSGTKAKYARMIIHIKAYMHYKKLPNFLRERILCYYEYRFQKTYFRDAEILNILCLQLREDIQVYTCKNLVTKVPFFKNINQVLLVRIAQELKHEFYLQNDVIIRAGTIADCMYFILTGTVAVYAQRGKEICHLSDGDHFGEIALVVPNKKRIASVVALEPCSLYRLDRKDFLKAIIPFPDLLSLIEQTAKERMETTEGRIRRHSGNVSIF